MGNTLGKLGRIEDAGRAYERALALKPRWLRPRLGLAEVALHRAQHGCGAKTSLPALVAARHGFAILVVPGDDLVRRAVRIRAQLGVARSDLCRSRVRPAMSARARAELRGVIAAIGLDTRSFGAQAAEAHAGLGLLALPREDEVADPGRLRTAIREYRAAATLTDDPARQRFFINMTTYAGHLLAGDRG